MASYRILIMARTNSHSLPPEKEGSRWRLGDIVDVFEVLPDEVPGPDGSPAFYRIYVTDVPHDLATVKRWLLEKHLQFFAVDSPKSAEERPLVARRKRLISLADIPVAVRQKIQKDRYLVVSFSVARDYIVKRAINQLDVYEVDDAVV